MPRSNGVLGSVENLPLTTQTFYLNCSLLPGEKYRVRSLVWGYPDTGEHAGLIFFEGAKSGEGLSASGTYGAYVYLRSGPGLHRTDRVITVDRPATRIGVRHSGNHGSVVLKTLTIERVDQNRPTDFLLSVDVEALPALAAGPRKIDSLVWGKFGGQEYGIRRICDVLDQYSAKASFLIEFATCSHEGDQPLRDIINFLTSRGHEIHMHLHADHLATLWGLKPSQESFKMDQLSYEMSRRTLDFAVKKYEEFVGTPPRVFRCGGLLVNKNIVAAAAALGIEALSNIRRDTAEDQMINGGDPIDGWEPFYWDNGVLELPLDFNPDPLRMPFADYVKRYEETVHKKPAEKIFQLLLHSKSLMSNDSLNFYNTHEPEHEKRLHQILSHMRERGRFFTFSEYLDSHNPPRPVRPLHDIRPPAQERSEYVMSADIVQCNICDAPFSTGVMVGNACPSCQSVPHHRQYKQMITNYGNVLEGRNVLAFEHALLQRWGILAGVKSAAAAQSANALRSLSVHSVDAVVGLNLITKRGDASVIADVARVLKPGGVFVSMPPYLLRAGAQEAGGTSGEFYFDEYLDLLSHQFRPSSVPGYDPVSASAARVFIAYKRP